MDFASRRCAYLRNTFSVKQFLADKRIPVLEHPPYSPDLAPCDFYLFPKVKIALKGTYFRFVEEVEAKFADLLKSLTPDELQYCLKH